MKTFEVRFVEVYHVEAEDENEAYDLALAAQDGEISREDADRVDYRYGDDSTREI